ncbi:hypothetical protein OAG71_01660 [bacterium]|nr:hypothetical protein [bacterium]
MVDWIYATFTLAIGWLWASKAELRDQINEVAKLDENLLETQKRIGELDEKLNSALINLGKVDGQISVLLARLSNVSVRVDSNTTNFQDKVETANVADQIRNQKDE